MVLALDHKITPQEFEQSREIYNDYIKIVIDMERDVIAVGGEFHIDCEDVLLKQGSKLENLYGGGYIGSSGQYHRRRSNGFIGIGFRCQWQYGITRFA